jgi:hypothetical protein
LGLPSLYDLGVNPVKVAHKMPFELRGPLTAYAYYTPDSIFDDPVVPPPKALSRLEEKRIIENSKQNLSKVLGLN